MLCIEITIPRPNPATIVILGGTITRYYFASEVFISTNGIILINLWGILSQILFLRLLSPSTIGYEGLRFLEVFRHALFRQQDVTFLLTGVRDVLLHFEEEGHSPTEKSIKNFYSLRGRIKDFGNVGLNGVWPSTSRLPFEDSLNSITVVSSFETY